MTRLGDGFRQIADLVDELEALGVRVSDVNPVAWEDTTEDGYLTAELIVGVPIEEDDGSRGDESVRLDVVNQETKDDGEESEVDNLSPNDVDEAALPEALGEMGESRSLVYTALVRDGEQPSRVLAATTQLSKETVRRSLRDLEAEEFVEYRDDPSDERVVLYSLADGFEDGDTDTDESEISAVDVDDPVDDRAETDGGAAVAQSSPFVEYDFEIPDHVTPEGLEAAVEASDTLSGVADALDWEDRAGVRALVFNEGHYDDLGRPEGRPGWLPDDDTGGDDA